MVSLSFPVLPRGTWPLVPTTLWVPNPPKGLKGGWIWGSVGGTR